MNLLTEETIAKLDFVKQDGLIPVIAQNIKNGEVLMLAYANKEAIEKTFETKLLTFFSRSKNRLWTKGESSGNHLKVEQLKYDCDGDTVLALVTPSGPSCHTGNRTCFGNDQQPFGFLSHLQSVIKERKESPTSGSYTTSLFESGINRIAQKVGEEGVEIVVAALAQKDGDLINESADLIYHLMVLLEEKGLKFDQVIAQLKERHQS